MFTGIVTEVGRVVRSDRRNGVKHMALSSRIPPEALPISQSLYLALHDPRDGVSFHMLR